MTEPLLLIDSSNLIHQALHTLGDLHDAEGVASGVTYGFLNRILSLGHTLQSRRFAFCWDGGPTSVRRNAYPQYKAARRAIVRTPEEQAAYAAAMKQERELRETILPALGFHDHRRQDGLEADDHMAAGAEQTPAIIVTADADLLQCITKEVSVFNPSSHKLTTIHTFIDEWKIQPKQWSLVLAIAGCDTDGVPGVRGVGKPSAAAWLRGELSNTTKRGAACKAWAMSEDEFALSFALVSLPHPDTKPVRHADMFPLSLTYWNPEMERLGFTSMIGNQRWEQFVRGEFSAQQERSTYNKQSGGAKDILQAREQRRKGFAL